MFTKAYHLLIILSWGVLLMSCRKNPHEIVPPSPTAPTGPTAVYVLGQADDTTRYWKNGVATSILGLPLTGLSPNAMAVSGNDVYVAGTIAHGLTETSAYWENGMPFTLQDPQAQSNGYAIFVSGGDVYVGGTTSNPFSLSVPYTTPAANYPISGPVATCWKNGVPAILPGDGVLQVYNGYGNYLYNDYISGLFVSGTDVYMAGGTSQFQMGNPSSYQFAKYWKNGVPVNLTNGLLDSAYSGSQYYITTFPYTSSIYVSGSDVYVAGNEYTFSTGPEEALYWKNGTFTLLPSAGSLTYANAIFVSGTDVYVAGNLKGADGIYHAVYWKNGVPDTLSVVPGGSSANAIFVYGNDVYAAGYENIGDSNYVTCWKNGVATHLSPSSLGSGGAALAIYVEAASEDL